MAKIYNEQIVLQKKFLGAVEVARIIEMSRITVNGWIKRGELKAVRTPGRHFRIRPMDLVSFLQSKGAYVPEALQQAVEKTMPAADAPAAQAISESVPSTHNKSVTEALNKVYSTVSSELDPAWRRQALDVLRKADW
ncbi:MAG: helix-turn-helix domain-containing protein [Candidatus Sumerlaeota bacterium]|nr:helix-turn-helix domain-containing protein [Candidatus Sumerlaeota bacterium]